MVRAIEESPTSSILKKRRLIVLRYFFGRNCYSDEPQPEEQVQFSFLRQCLENAMASELSPHERDILRLRLGLDDGVTRSSKEVAELCGGVLTVSDVRTAQVRAFKKLRSPYAVHTQLLMEYLDKEDLDDF